MTRDVLDYLDDIIDAMSKVEKFTEGMDYIAFAQDDKTTFAVIRALEIIGEAVKKIPSTVRVQYPDVPWREMAGMRDKLMHQYFGVSSQVVWDTVQKDIPALKPVFEKVRSDLMADRT